MRDPSAGDFRDDGEGHGLALAHVGDGRVEEGAALLGSLVGVVRGGEEREGVRLELEALAAVAEAFTEKPKSTALRPVVIAIRGCSTTSASYSPAQTQDKETTSFLTLHTPSLLLPRLSFCHQFH